MFKPKTAVAYHSSRNTIPLNLFTYPSPNVWPLEFVIHRRRAGREGFWPDAAALRPSCLVMQFHERLPSDPAMLVLGMVVVSMKC